MSKEALAQRVARRPEHRDLRLRPPGHPRRPDRPPRAGDARVPRRLRPQADGHLAAAAATRYLTTSGNVSEHSTGTAVDIAAINGDPDPRPPGRGLDHRADDPAAADAAGHDEAAPDHLADDVRGRRQHVRDGRPRRPHPRRLPPALRRQREGGEAGRRDPQAEAVDQADRPARRDRQPDGRAQAVEVRGQGRASAPARPTRASSDAARTSASSSGSSPGGSARTRAATSCAATRATTPQQVVVIGGLDAPRRRRARRPRARARPSRTPTPVEVTRATVIARRPARRTSASADAWLAAARAPSGGDDGRGAGGAQPRARTPTGSPPPTRTPAEVARRARARHARRLRDRRAGRRGRAGRRRASCRADAAARARARPRCARRSASPRCSAARDAALACEQLALRARLRPRPRPRARGGAPARGRARRRRCAELEGWRELGGMAGAAGRARRRWPTAVARGGRGGAGGRRWTSRRGPSSARARAARGRAAGARRRGGRTSAEGRRRRRIDATVGRRARSLDEPAGSSAASDAPRARRPRRRRACTAARASYGVGPFVTSATAPPARERDLRQLGDRVDLERGADAEQQVGRAPRASDARVERRLRQQLAEQHDVGLQRRAAVAARHAVGGRLEPRAHLGERVAARRSARQDDVRDRAVDLDQVARAGGARAGRRCSA